MEININSIPYQKQKHIQLLNKQLELKKIGKSLFQESPEEIQLLAIYRCIACNYLLAPSITKYRDLLGRYVDATFFPKKIDTYRFAALYHTYYQDDFVALSKVLSDPSQLSNLKIPDGLYLMDDDPVELIARIYNILSIMNFDNDRTEWQLGQTDLEANLYQIYRKLF